MDINPVSPYSSGPFSPSGGSSFSPIHKGSFGSSPDYSPKVGYSPSSPSYQPSANSSG